MRIIVMLEEDPEILEFLEGKNVWTVELKKGLDFRGTPLGKLEEFLGVEKKGEKESRVIDVVVPRCERKVTQGQHKGKKCPNVAYKNIDGTNYCVQHYGSKLPECAFATRYKRCTKKTKPGETLCEKHKNVKQCTAPITQGKNSGTPCLQIVPSGKEFCLRHQKK